MKHLIANNLKNLFSYIFIEIEMHYISLHLKALEYIVCYS